MNSSLVPESYYRVTPNKGPNPLDALLGYATAAGDAVNSYAYSQPTGSIGRVLLGADRNTQMNIGRTVGKIGSAIPGVGKEAAFRFASSAPVKQALRVVPGLSVAGAALAAGDVVFGDESVGNRVMDAAAMGTGAAIGTVLGGGVFSPVTASIGATVGKTLSDGTQWLFGDKKTPEQRKMELALQQLQGGGMV